MCLWDTWRINHKGNVCMFRVRACLYRLGCWEFLLKPLLYIPKRVASANIVSASANNTEEGSSLKKFWGVRTFWPVTFLGIFPFITLFGYVLLKEDKICEGGGAIVEQAVEIDGNVKRFDREGLRQ